MRALEVLERLTALRAYTKLSPLDRGQIDFSLARALVAADRDPDERARALPLAREALERLRSAGAGAESEAASCERWFEAQTNTPDRASP